MPKSNDDNVYEWTEESLIKLIREYKIRPVLWNPKDPWFHKASYRNIGWGNIGKVLSTPADICKIKMMNLLSTFQRERKKSNSGWVMMPYMKFLLERSNKQKKVKSSTGKGKGDKEPAEIYNLVDSEPDIVKIENDNDNLEVTVEESNCSTQPSTSNTLVKTLANNPTQPPAPLAQPGVSYAQMVHIQNEQTNMDEEIDAFTTFVNTKMKKYSMSTVNEVQRQIFEILFKTDQIIQQPPNPNGTRQIIITDMSASNVFAYAPTAINSTQVSNNTTIFNK